MQDNYRSSPLTLLLQAQCPHLISNSVANHLLPIPLPPCCHLQWISQIISPLLFSPESLLYHTRQIQHALPAYPQATLPRETSKIIFTSPTAPPSPISQSHANLFRRQPAMAFPYSVLPFPDSEKIPSLLPSRETLQVPTNSPPFLSVRTQ